MPKRPSSGQPGFEGLRQAFTKRAAPGPDDGSRDHQRLRSSTLGSNRGPLGYNTFVARDGIPGFEPEKGWDPVRNRRGAGAACAYCREMLPWTASRSCSRCGVIYHPECWKANQSRCAVYGCEPPQRPPERRRPAAVAAGSRSGVPNLGGRWVWVAVILASAVSRVANRHEAHPSARLHTPDIQARPLLGPGSGNRGEIRGSSRDWGEEGSGAQADRWSSLSLYRRAIDKISRRDLAGALSDIDQAVGRDPRSGPAWRCRAYIRDEQGDHDGAIEDATRALEIDPSDAQALEYRGAARQVKGDLAGALRDYDRQLELAPTAMAYVNRAVVQKGLGAAGEARASLRQAIELEPRNVRAYRLRAQMEDEEGDYRRAFADFFRATELDPRNAGLHVELGSLLRELGDPEGAEREYSKGIELDPEYGPAYLDRAYLRYDQGHWQGSKTDFQKALLRQPAERDYISIRLWLLAARDGQRASANWSLADVFKHRIQAGASDWTSKIASYLIGAKSEAEFLRSMDEPDPKGSLERSCEAYYYIGCVHRLDGDPAGAAGFFRKCVDTHLTTWREYASAEAALQQLR
jgi:tetratricopeptide (TPR) repeat protein